MEGSVGQSGTVPTNQNNSNPWKEASEVEKKPEDQKGQIDVPTTETDEQSSSATLAQLSSAQSTAQGQTPDAEDTRITGDTDGAASSKAAHSPLCQEQTASDSSDAGGAGSGMPSLPEVPDSDEEAGTTSGLSSEQVPADASAEREPQQSDSQVVSVSAPSSSCSDAVPSQQQTEELRPSEGTEPVEPVTVSEGSSQDHPSLSPAVAAAAQEKPAVSAEPSLSQTSSLLSASAAESSTSAQSEEGATASKTSRQGESVYYIKWITFDGSKVPIITQNENGPCPLLAIMNVLLLKGKVRLAPMLEMVTSEQLMAYLGDCVFESMPQNLSETARANYEQNMQDAMAVMHRLQTGLDVNVKFTGVSDFEYTPECIIFDLLEIGLYHGWLVDPQDDQSVAAVSKCSYNQLVEKIIQQKASDKDNLLREALLAEQFLERTASQLTYHGLCELSSTIKEHELSIFFRNNHFSTLYRHNSELFLLVTDQGFLTESSVVWETLSNVDGDCHFVDAGFCTYTKPEPSAEPIPSSPYSSGDTQIDSDYQVALSLQQDQQLMAEQEAAWGQFHPDPAAAHQGDHELAMRLQEEEDRRAAAALQEQRNQQGQGQGQVVGQGQAVAAGAAAADRRVRERDGREERRDKKEGKDCAIL